MIDYSILQHHDVLCIDSKSFYASVECISRGLDPLTTYLVVVGDKNRSGSVVLASSPAMKKHFKIKTGNRLFEIPKDGRIHVVEARMGLYLEASMAVSRLLNTFVPIEAIHTYSCDESWICLDGTTKLWGDKWEAARLIKKTILKRFGLPVCIGIGPNKFLAKAILDTEAKKKGIAECRYEDVQEKLWPVPIEDIWGIGHRMKKNLNRVGIFRLGDLANFPVKVLKQRYGVMGEQLWAHSWGIDESPVTGMMDFDFQKGFGHGITLLRDYNGDEIATVILELAEEVCRRTRQAKMAGKTVHFGLGYSKFDEGGGFSRSRSFEFPTNVTMDVYQLCVDLFHENYNGRSSIRSIHLSLNNLSKDNGVQLDLFSDKTKRRTLGYTMDDLRERFGSTAILRARSYTNAGVTIERSQKIGGHHA